MKKQPDIKSTDTDQLEKLKKECEEYKNKYLRALADYQNLEKRITNERAREKEFAVEEFVIRLLPIIDLLEKARISLKNDGLDLIIKQLYDILEREQIKKIEVIGKKFDPHFMECIETIEGDKEDEVVEEVRAGFMMRNKVIRVAQVKVSKKREQQSETSKQS